MKAGFPKVKCSLLLQRTQGDFFHVKNWFAPVLLDWSKQLFTREKL
jgi:hypothetical protein